MIVGRCPDLGYNISAIIEAFRKCLSPGIDQNRQVVHIPAQRGVDVRDKRAKFVGLAEARVNRAIKEMRLIGNLSNRGAYEWNEDDVRKIFRALQRELETARARFTGDSSKKEEGFRL